MKPAKLSQLLVIGSICLTFILIFINAKDALVFGGTYTDSISVNVTSVLNDTSRKQIGVNMNYLSDDDKNSAARTNSKSTTTALSEMGVKFLRYPGGEKADSYLWSTPPYDAPRPTLARTGSCEWPANDNRLVQSDYKSYQIDPLDFDEFMTMAKTIGAEPVIVVAYDSMFKASTCGQPVPTKQQLLDNATSWVKYANKTKGYNVKYWEIGNETYLNSYNGSTDANTYANDLVTFSNAMKAVDPTIKIGANGDQDAWWQTVIQTAGAKIDFLSVHNYPNWEWGNYEYYRTNNVSLIDAVNTAVNSINSYSANSTIKNKLKIAVTEVNSADWSTGGWPSINNLGHALVLFDTLGQQLKQKKVDFSQVWNTRWVDYATNPTELWDTLDTNNNTTATGKALSIWGNFLGTNLVNSGNTSMVRSYATYSPATKKLSVFLINKDTIVRTTRVVLQNITSTSLAKRYVLKGTGSEDTKPAYSQIGDLLVSNTTPIVQLDPVSVTVLTFQGK